MTKTRRQFVKELGVVTVASPIVYSIPFNINYNAAAPLEMHIFSKHLQFLNWADAAAAAKEIGFIGLDLTVRPKGHVLPENVLQDLPLAIQAVKAAGLSCEMITTAVEDVRKQTDHDVIVTAASEGVKYYRCNWFKYKEEQDLEASLEYYKSEIWRLGKMNKKYDIIGCYQNHSGLKVGASVWEVNEILKKVDQKYFGAQYDIRHAVAEGGRSWPNGVQLLRDKIKTIVLKDFKWGQVDGKWKIVNVPIGEGMVDFKAYFKLLKEYKLAPPVSLHVEYPIGGAEKGKKEITVDKSVVFQNMKRDLTTLQAIYKEA